MMGGDKQAAMMERGKSVHRNHPPPSSSPCLLLFLLCSPPRPRSSLLPPPRSSRDKVRMGCGIGCHSARLSLITPHKMPFRVPRSNNWCILLQREMGSERMLWMFLLSHTGCVTVGQDGTRTKRKSAARILFVSGSRL